MLSHPSHQMDHSTTILVVPLSHCDANITPSWSCLVVELFGTFTDLVGSSCQNLKFVSYIAVMAQTNKPAGTTADPLAVLKAALTLLMPNQPATNLKTPTFE